MGSLPRKKKIVETIEGQLKQANMMLVLDYRGLTMTEMTLLRRELLKEQADLTVAKNTLLRRAIKGTNVEELGAFLKGPTAVAYGTGDQVKPVKIIKEFLKKNKKENELRGGVLDGKALSAKDVDALASLPSFEELRAKLVGGIAYPLTGLVMALSGPQRSLVNVLDQYGKKHAKQS